MKSAPDAARGDVASLIVKAANTSAGSSATPLKTARPTHLGPQIAPSISRFERIFRVLIWLVTLSLLAVVALRVLDHDGFRLLIWLNAFTRYVYLPAYACLAWAVWKRRWILAVANVAVVVFHIGLLAPDFVRDRRFDQAGSTLTDAAAAPHVRIFFANVANLNDEHDAMLREIKQADPDVVVLAEFTWLWRAAFLRSPIIAAYPYGNGPTDVNYGTVNVFSRIPLKKQQQHSIAGRCIQAIEIPVGSQTLRIVGLHAPRPMNLPNYDYDGFCAARFPCSSPRKAHLSSSAIAMRRNILASTNSSLPSGSVRPTKTAAADLQPPGRMASFGSRRSASIRHFYRPRSSAWTSVKVKDAARTISRSSSMLKFARTAKPCELLLCLPG